MINKEGKVDKGWGYELIWASSTFYPKTIKGINPSKDGNYYTSIEQDKSKT